MVIELDPVDRITADAVGSPGERAFYLQARKDDRLVTLLVEKQQVQLLAASVVEILARVGKETGEGPPETAMELEDPLLPEWRAGRLSIGYLEDRDLLMLEAEELVPDAEEEDGEEDGEEEEGPGEDGNGEDGEEVANDLAELGRELGVAGLAAEDEPKREAEEGHEPGRVRFWATREQMLSLARHGALVCAAGRPRCQFCGNPIEPEGHVCPAMNGHREFGEQ
jgi:uncharacterized repeat protein (TIGR03847 family)